MKYYRAYCWCGDWSKNRQYNRTIYVQTSNQKTPASDVLDVIRKLPWGRLITAQQIDREQYLKGVSKSRG